MSFELDRLPEYTDGALLSEIRRVAASVGGNRLTITEFAKLSKVSVTTLRRRLGSWPKALEAAGLAHLYNAVTPATKSRVLARSLTDSEIINEIRRVGQTVGRTELTAEDLRQHASVGVDAIRNRFGTLKKALRTAGLYETASGRRYSDEECFENLLRVWTHLGRPPRYQELKQPPSIVGPKAYLVRWKTWNRALSAFVERVNSDRKPEEVRESSTVAQINSSQVTIPENEEDAHCIRLGLRYKVLVRDKFKCALCGNSPAVDSKCRLHVDHVLPWSKGGKTTEDNLRTLCEQCNLGKSNRIDEGQSR